MTTKSAFARRVAHRYPSWSATEIARYIGASRQLVEAALSTTHARQGRPGGPSRTVRVPSHLLDRARVLAEQSGFTLREFIAIAVADHIVQVEGFLSVKPPSDVTRGVTDRSNAKRKRRRVADGKDE